MRPVPLALIVVASTAIAATPQSTLADGLAAYAAGRFEVARRDFTALADDGSAIGETMLGSLFARGQGVRRDPAAAAAYYLRAANRGYAPAQLAFSRALARGDGVTRDPRAAWQWLRLAQARGDARVVAAAKADAARLARTSPPPPADEVADWRPWPTPEE